ncbi:MAG TPA: heparinase II/III family protein, partial [Pyrinomonadaceae bacterium]
MSVKTMVNPLETLRKIKGRSWDELRTRGAQEFSARGEQIGLSGKLPTDDEFYKLLDSSAFGETESTPEIILEKFYEAAEFGFFPAFRQKENTLAAFRNRFAERAERSIVEKAEKIVGGKFDLLGFVDLNFGTPVDWHFEPISGKRSPLKHWKQFDELDAEETGDKKIVWELNRHQHFFTLGAAYWLTGDERYAEIFARHLEKWMEENPPGTGVNWVSSLEIAFRAMSWLWALNFFRDAKSVSPELMQNALKFLHLHGRHIEKYLSTYYSPNTHLTGEALGLYYLGTQLSFFERAAHWRKLGEEILAGELERQILNDGIYFEQTTWYQRYTTDFYAHFLILRRLSGEENDRETTERIENRAQSAFDFLMYLTRPDGTTPLIGDDDGGRMLPLSGAAPNDFRATLAIGAILFGRGDYKSVAGEMA